MLGTHKSKDRALKSAFYMDKACRVAARGLGRVAPNPSVGCVILDQDDELIALARTHNGGRPHAEYSALNMAGAGAKGGAAYVTLEPCAHEGETPSCARLLIEAGLKRVVIGISDPDSRTSGRGIEMLTNAGVEVELLEHTGAQTITQGFVSRVLYQRPFTTLKIAVSKNGYMRTAKGQSPQITGDGVKRIVHLMRADHDAILTGIGTALADDPALDCRLQGMADFSPNVYVLDRHGRFSADLQLDGTRTEVLSLGVLTGITASQTMLGDLEAKTVLEYLGFKGVNRLMIEAGPRVAAHFLSSGLIDEIVLFRAPFDLIPDESMAKCGDLDYMRFSQFIADFDVVMERSVDQDLMCVWRKRNN